LGTIALTLPVSGTVITAGLLATDMTTIQNFANGGLRRGRPAVGVETLIRLLRRG
jgi:hypothetical protein